MKNDINQKAIAASLGHSKSIITFDVYTDKQALIEGGVEEIDAFIDEVHPYDSEDIQILKRKIMERKFCIDWLNLYGKSIEKGILQVICCMLFFYGKEKSR